MTATSRPKTAALRARMTPTAVLGRVRLSARSCRGAGAAMGSPHSIALAGSEATSSAPGDELTQRGEERLDLGRCPDADAKCITKIGRVEMTDEDAFFLQPLLQRFEVGAGSPREDEVGLARQR